MGYYVLMKLPYMRFFKKRGENSLFYLIVYIINTNWGNYFSVF